MKSLPKRLSAGMLPTVLVICLVLTLICSALISMAYFRYQILLRDALANRVARNVQSAIAYSLAGSLQIYEQPTLFDLFGTGKDSVRVERGRWGLFDVIKAEAFIQAHRQSRFALIGTQPAGWGMSTLYLTDENRPLSLAGNTLIQGNCALPKAGVRTAYVEGKGYSGKQLVEGTINTSNASLPALSSLLLDRLRYYSRLAETPPFPTIPLSTVRSPTVYSFKDSPVVIRLPKDAVLEKVDLSGHCILTSPGNITIAPAAQLSDVILVARKVTLQAGFTGKLQIFAQDTVLLEEGARLRYPSALVVYNETGKCRLQMGKSSILEGILLVKSDRSETLNNVVAVGKESILEGEAYVDGLVELKGRSKGALACRRFFLLTPTTLYENHLLDARLNVASRSPYYLSSPLLAKGNANIVQWLP